MLKIIPAIDLLGGQCVRLKQGDYAQKTAYHSDPIEVAQEMEQKGFSQIHVVDLDGAKGDKMVNGEVLSAICENTNIKVDFGGGLKGESRIEEAFSRGVDQVTIGTIAVENPGISTHILKEYGPDKVILGADVFDFHIATHGWKTISKLHIDDFLREYYNLGLRYCICTDIKKDGMMSGSSKDLYRHILQQFPELKLIASGGVHTAEEIIALDQIGCYGAIVGKAYYEQTIDFTKVSKYIW